MNPVSIIILVLVAIFIVGGAIAGHYATKISENDTDTMNKNQK
ncbi:hypothetical protein [Pseudobacteroides cellulosolvens]|uniref:Uncharacterized protein n=1 Tax=Pseudobacteroides cellulosolvens ATCC 35603 = DSM 2933 TaxID=398512 RepID=A0A0L6JJ60_9FIRM|nr:hypothetical protein [Pseudobacteroides cellulosolvens]KNY25770.1 hypothetical protein Bccel_1030 [Pseudobacteroides cellulosolvens ATCC 35603 = DSM 2933]